MLISPFGVLQFRFGPVMKSLRQPQNVKWQPVGTHGGIVLQIVDDEIGIKKICVDQIKCFAASLKWRFEIVFLVSSHMSVYALFHFLFINSSCLAMQLWSQSGPSYLRLFYPVLFVQLFIVLFWDRWSMRQRRDTVLFEPGPCLHLLKLRRPQSALWESVGSGAAASRGPSGHYAHEGSAPS